MKKLHNIFLGVAPWLLAMVDMVCVFSITSEIFDEVEGLSFLISVAICFCLDVLPGWASSTLDEPLLWQTDFKWSRWRFLASISVFCFVYLCYVAFTLIVVRSILLNSPDSWVEAWGNIVRMLIPIATSIASLLCGFRGQTQARLQELETQEDDIQAEIDEKAANIHRIETELEQFHAQKLDDEMYKIAVEREISSMERAFWRVHIELCKALEADPDSVNKILDSEAAVKSRIEEIRKEAPSPISLAEEISTEHSKVEVPNAADIKELPLSA